MGLSLMSAWYFLFLCVSAPHLNNPETNTGQGLFRCGADTHKNKKYQELIRDSFKLNLFNFVGETSKQNELRANLGHILALKTTRDKVINDGTINVDIRDTTVGELDAKIQKLAE